VHAKPEYCWPPQPLQALLERRLRTRRRVVVLADALGERRTACSVESREAGRGAVRLPEQAACLGDHERLFSGHEAALTERLQRPTEALLASACAVPRRSVKLANAVPERRLDGSGRVLLPEVRAVAIATVATARPEPDATQHNLSGIERAAALVHRQGGWSSVVHAVRGRGGDRQRT